MLSLIQVIAGRPWAIRGDIAAHVHGLIAREGIAGLRHLAEFKRQIHATDGRMAGGRGRRSGGAIGVVPIYGVLTQRGDVIDSAETRSTTAIGEEVATLATDPKVDAIVLDIDSPGGEVYGIPEAWAVIKAAASVKPVVAVSNAQEASAALYLGSAATEKWVTPSGEIGSLGVYAMHVDESEALAAEGVRVEYVIADESPFKVEGNSAEPLSDEGRAQIKKSVNRYMSMFVRDVAKGRGVSVEHVRQHFGKGRMLGPQEAVAARMADKVGTLDEAIRRASQLARERRDGKLAAGTVAAEAEPVTIGERQMEHVTTAVTAEPKPSLSPAALRAEWVKANQ